MVRFIIKDAGTYKELCSGRIQCTHEAFVDTIMNTASICEIKVKPRAVQICAAKLMHQLDAYGTLRDPPQVRCASGRLAGMFISMTKEV